MSNNRRAIFNPHSKPIDDLPVIYGFNNGGSDRNYFGVLMAADGTELGSHVSLAENFMLNDLGILDGSRPDLHVNCRSHYPDGYRMQFVRFDDVPKTPGLMSALKIAKANQDVIKGAMLRIKPAVLQRNAHGEIEDVVPADEDGGVAEIDVETFPGSKNIRLTQEDGNGATRFGRWAIHVSPAQVPALIALLAATLEPGA